MNSYELLLILRSDIADEERAAVLDRIREIVTANEGTIVRIDEWGKRRLAYEIKDCLDGVYYVLYFEATAETLAEVNRVLRITDGVLRFMSVRHDKPFSSLEPAAVPEPADAEVE